MHRWKTGRSRPQVGLAVLTPSAPGSAGGTQGQNGTGPVPNAPTPLNGAQITAAVDVMVNVGLTAAGPLKVSSLMVGAPQGAFGIRLQTEVEQIDFNT